MGSYVEQIDQFSPGFSELSATLPWVFNFISRVLALSPMQLIPERVICLACE